ncbi:MAG: GtrA family protein [Chloroflexi bacterium]|nr:MAG: GtrA family protein [Chloroflexota bacterium]
MLNQGTPLVAGRLLALARANRKELERFIKFSIVGAIGAVVDFGSFNLMVNGLGLLPEMAGAISFVLAICSNFLWNRYWTYPDSRSKPVAGQFLQFFVVNAAGIVIRIPILWLTRRPLGRLVAHLTAWGPVTAQRLGNNLALALAVGIVMFWNFFVNRYWTYNDVE